MVTRAARVAVVVGTILVAINQAGLGAVAHVALTFSVPFLVSMYSMLGMVPELRPGQRSATDGVYRCRSCPALDQGEAVVSAGDSLPPCPQCGAAARWIPIHV